MTRPLHATVDLGALRGNVARVRQLAPGRRVMAVVKADAYGHGIARVCRALAATVDSFAVCCLEEAEQVMQASPRSTVVMLEGCHDEEELRQAARMGLEVIVHCEEQLRMLELCRPQRALTAWLKIDSGMHRLGVPAETTTAAWERLLAARGVAPSPRLLTHLATAGEAEHALTTTQLQRFTACTRGLRAERSIANSAAVLNLPQSHADWVRPGVMLYGASPLADGDGAAHGLKPVMTLHSQLIAVHHLAAGEHVGYGADWSCPEAMPVGIAAVGYGDGYPRHARSGTPILVNGRRAAVIAPASMDMLAVDLRACPDARRGDPVLLWGDGLAVEEVAAGAGTIPHQLLCGVNSRVRVQERDDGP